MTKRTIHRYYLQDAKEALMKTIVWATSEHDEIEIVSTDTDGDEAWYLFAWLVLGIIVSIVFNLIF